MARYLYGLEKLPSEIAGELDDLQESNFEVKESSFENTLCNTLPNIMAEHVMYEQWSQIQNKLKQEPHIFAVKYSDRVDLLRVMLIGVKGTPYHHGLFFFDFYIHSEFPAKPPKVQALWYHNNTYSPNTWDEVEKVCGVNHVPRGINLMIDYLSQCLKGTESRANNTWEYFYNTVPAMKGIIFIPPSYFENVVYQHFKHHEKSIRYEFMAYSTGNFEVGKYEEKTGVWDEQVNLILEYARRKYLFDSLGKTDEYYNFLGPHSLGIRKPENAKLEWAKVHESFIKELKDNANCTFKFLDDDDDGEEN